MLRTNISLKISPFDFERTIELRENEKKMKMEISFTSVIQMD